MRVTKFVDALVNGEMEHVARDDNEEFFYSPIFLGYRPGYYRYTKEIGYIAQAVAKGRVAVKADPSYKGSFKSYVDQGTYVRVWKRDYPQLEVSKTAEDICELCLRFRNRYYQFLAKITFC